ncbi:MAG TPA: pantoate--beta-alanine ligase [Stellaceae bacterium]|nr:pantoate--beta-alanine ligase [Stellaceae bacterium]
MADDRIAVVREVAALRAAVADWRNDRRRIALVPTMGAIHRGHLALVAAARRQCERVVASLFVNPKQFGPAEDFAAYPRDEEADVTAFAAAGVDLVFAPTVDEMYPAGFATSLHVAAFGDGLEGAHRPGHFDGVATVVAKLLLQALPDAAYFGEKDYQQLLVVRRLVRDLDIGVHIEGVPTLREPDGLALSSRNVYLSPTERPVAPLLHRVMQQTAAALRTGTDAAAALDSGRAQLLATGFAVDYLELREAATLAPLARLDAPARLLAAARLGRTRLIDNLPVAP